MTPPSRASPRLADRRAVLEELAAVAAAVISDGRGGSNNCNTPSSDNSDDLEL
jgi:hypothetical protein